MNKLSPFNAQFITQEFFPQYKDKPQFINYGQCFQWSYLAHRIYADTELWDVRNHAFIKYKGKFFDSERIHGVMDWRELPAVCPLNMKSCPRIAKPHNELGFKLCWGYARQSYGLKWDKLRQQADEFIKRMSK